MAKDKSKSKEKGKEALQQEKQPSKAALQKQQAKEQAKKDSFWDKIKILIAIVIVSASFWAYYNMPQLNPYVKSLIPIAGVILAILIVFFWCASGRRLIQFVKDATIELKKVARPDKKQTMQLTIYVIGFVALLSAYMWFSDYLSNLVLYEFLFRR